MSLDVLELLAPTRPVTFNPKRYVCVFQASWWLNVYSGNHYHRDVTVVENGETVGRLVFLVRRNRLGMKCGLLPAWAHLGGPVLDNRLSSDRKAEVLRQLIDKLPRNISYLFACDSRSPVADLVNAAFKRAKFSHRRIETYCQSPGDDDVLSRLTKKQRKHLRQAEKDVEISPLNGREFAKLYQANLTEGGKKSYLPLHYVQDIIDGGMAQIPPQVRVFAARKKRQDGSASRPEIAIACAWDTQRYYFWLLTRPLKKMNGDSCHPDTVKLLFTHAMDHAKSLGLVFDSDGAGSEGSAKLYRDLMKLPGVEWRDIYMRDTRMYKAFKSFKALASRFRLARS